MTDRRDQRRRPSIDLTRTLATLTLWLAAAAGALAADPVAPFELRYEVRRNGDLLGEATFRLRALDDARRELETHTRGTQGLAALLGADIRERSVFRWRDGRPELIAYSYRQKAAWKNRQRTLDVDAAHATIASRDGERNHTLALEAGVMDRHAVVVALAAEVARGDEAALEFRVADKDEVETHRYRRAGRERVRTPAGRFEAERVERVREKPGRTTTTWLAVELGYLPARILQQEPDGETIEMQLVERTVR